MLGTPRGSRQSHTERERASSSKGVAGSYYYYQASEVNDGIGCSVVSSYFSPAYPRRGVKHIHTHSLSLFPSLSLSFSFVRACVSQAIRPSPTNPSPDSIRLFSFLFLFQLSLLAPYRTHRSGSENCNLGPSTCVSKGRVKGLFVHLIALKRGLSKRASAVPLLRLFTPHNSKERKGESLSLPPSLSTQHSPYSFPSLTRPDLHRSHTACFS